MTSGFERGDDDIRRVIEAYLERHPERNTSFERRATASRHAVAARARATRGMAGPALRRLGKSLALDPREPALEAWAALPALRGHARHALARRSQSRRRD